MDKLTLYEEASTLYVKIGKMYEMLRVWVFINEIHTCRTISVLLFTRMVQVTLCWKQYALFYTLPQSTSFDVIGIRYILCSYRLVLYTFCDYPLLDKIILLMWQFDNNPNNGPGSNGGKRSWNDKLGKCDFTLAFILLLNFQSSSGDPSHISLRCLPSPQEVTSSVRGFTSWVIWGKTWEESSSFLKRSTQLSLILLKHGQYDAVKVNPGL